MKAKMVLDERGHRRMWLMFRLLNNIDMCIQEQNYNGGIYGGGGKLCCPNEYEVEVVVNTCTTKMIILQTFSISYFKMIEPNLGFLIPY